jgi:putative PIN family toxin of toxin-antitoxin system
MQRVVLDTNILVSALWTPVGNPSTIVSLVLSDKIMACFDYRILNEYRTVLIRPKFGFSRSQVDALLAEITNRGLTITVTPSTISIPDETDRKFFDVAKACEACLITGNIKHYPKDPLVMTPARFLR